MAPLQTLPIEINTALLSQNKLKLKSKSELVRIINDLKSQLPEGKKNVKYRMTSFMHAGWDILSKDTQKAYNRVYETFDKIINKPIIEITCKDIVVYINYLDNHKTAKGKGYSNATINQHIAGLSKKCNMFVLSGILKSNPVAVLSKAKRGSIYRAQKQDVNKNKLPFKNYNVNKVINAKHTATGLIIKFIANTGCRINELINIRNENLKPFTENGIEYYSVEITKGKGNKTRIIPAVTASLITDIKKIFKCKSDYLFHVIHCRQDRLDRRGAQLDRVNMYKQIRSYFENNTRDRKRKGKETKTGLFCRPHMLRKYYLQELNSKGLNLNQTAEIAGHANINTLVHSYLDNSVTAKKCVIHE